MKAKISKILLLFVLTTLTTSCMIDGINRVTGNRNVTTENRKVNEHFTEIHASNGIDVYITQDDNESITVECDENLQDVIKTEISNGVLKIYSKKNIWRAKSKKVYVSAKEINTINATSGSDVVSENTINTKVLTISTTSGADAKILVNATTVNSSATSGSDLKIIGKSEYHSSKATSGSSIYAYELESENVIANVTSGADINVNATKSLEAKATSGGDIDYKGNPKKIIKKTTSGGSISSN